MLIMVLLFIGTTEIIVIGAIALLLFGGKKLPELMRGLGKGMKEFKEGMAEKSSEDRAEIENPVDGSQKEEEPQEEKPQDK